MVTLTGFVHRASGKLLLQFTERGKPVKATLTVSGELPDSATRMSANIATCASEHSSLSDLNSARKYHGIH
jgi:hypothetical protein